MYYNHNIDNEKDSIRLPTSQMQSAIASSKNFTQWE